MCLGYPGMEGIKFFFPPHPLLSFFHVPNHQLCFPRGGCFKLFVMAALYSPLCHLPAIDRVIYIINGPQVMLLWGKVAFFPPSFFLVLGFSFFLAFMGFCMCACRSASGLIPQCPVTSSNRKLLVMLQGVAVPFNPLPVFLPNSSGTLFTALQY